MAVWTTPVTSRGFGMDSYNVSDLNRVEGNAEYLSFELGEIGYTNTMTTKTNWNELDFFTESEDERYISNIENLKSLVAIETVLPSSLEDITKTKANTIESVQLEIKNRVERIKNNRLFASMPASNNRILQFIRRG